MLADIIIRFCLWLSRKTPPKVYTGRNTSSPYLTRYFLTKASARSEGMEDDNPPPWGLYLHRFHRGDDDPQLHNHPWKWAVSLVLKGGYSEERRISVSEREAFRRLYDGDDSELSFFGIKRRSVWPWSLNFLTHRDFHRVDLFCGDAWTLFLVGPVKQSWGFWDRVTKVYTPWKKFLGLSS